MCITITIIISLWLRKAPANLHPNMAETSYCEHVEIIITDGIGTPDPTP